MPGLRPPYVRGPNGAARGSAPPRGASPQKSDTATTAESGSADSGAARPQNHGATNTAAAAKSVPARRSSRAGEAEITARRYARCAARGAGIAPLAAGRARSMARRGARGAPPRGGAAREPAGGSGRAREEWGTRRGRVARGGAAGRRGPPATRRRGTLPAREEEPAGGRPRAGLPGRLPPLGRAPKEALSPQ